LSKEPKLLILKEQQTLLMYYIIYCTGDKLEKNATHSLALAYQVTSAVWRLAGKP
jgi:hypothetical protein